MKFSILFQFAILNLIAFNLHAQLQEENPYEQTNDSFILNSYVNDESNYVGAFNFETGTKEILSEKSIPQNEASQNKNFANNYETENNASRVNSCNSADNTTSTSAITENETKNLTNSSEIPPSATTTINVSTIDFIPQVARVVKNGEVLKIIGNGIYYGTITVRNKGHIIVCGSTSIYGSVTINNGGNYWKTNTTGFTGALYNNGTTHIGPSSCGSDGSWSIVSGGGSITGDVYTPADVSLDTSVTIRYTIPTDGSCASTSDDVTFLVTSDVSPCSDGAIVGTPTLNDTDGDGINNICDLDDDNDGILDEDEACANSVSGFPNAEKGYLFQGNPTTVILVDILDGTSEATQTLDYYINGVAVNEDDGYFWAIHKNVNKVVLIDPYSFNIVETIDIDDTAVSGAYDPIKKQYVTVTKTLVQVFDGNPNSPTYKTQVASFAGMGKNVIDLGYNTSDGALYGIPSGTNDLYKVDTTNETVTLVGDIANLPNGSYGAIYTTLDGNFYMSNNSSGVIYKMELRNGLSATFFSNGPASGTNDGAKVLSVDLSGNQVCLDTDDDGTPNSQDLDSDADGYYDVIEAGGVDDDGDGMLDGTGVDADGIVTGGTGGYSGGSGGTEAQAHRMNVDTPPSDQTVGFGDSASFTVVASADQATNYLDGVPVYDTPGNATNRIVYQWYLGDPDNGGTALTNSAIYSNVDTATLTINTPDGLYGNVYYIKLTHLDISILEETASATLIADPCDAVASGNPDADSDGVSDSCDLDNDNDGILDTNEQTNGANTDTDGDGIIDSLDNDADNDGCLDVKESGGIDANGDGILDGTGIDNSNGQVTGGSGGYNGVTGNEIIAQKVEITTAPSNISVSEDATASFMVSATSSTATSYNSGTPVYGSVDNDSANITYQWYEGDPDNGGQAIIDQGIYAGANTAALEIEIVSNLDNTDYYVVIGNANSCVSDVASATLTVNAAAPNTTTLIISQYIESDSGNSPNGIEIFNPSTGAFNFTNNNVYVNVGGPGNFVNELVINSGSLAGGEVMVIGSSELGDYLNQNDLSDVTFIQHNFTFDGDDAIMLSDTATYGGTIIDMFGEITATDPGDAWSGSGVETRNCNLSIKDYDNDDQFFSSGTNSGWSDPSSRFVQTNANPSGARGLEGCGEAPVRNRWIGNQNDDFHDGNNWRDNRRNLYCDNLVIPNSGVTDYPISYSPVVVRSIKLESGAQFKPNASCSAKIKYESEFSTTNWYLIGSPLSGNTFDDDFISTNNVPTAGTDRAFAKYDTPNDSWDYLQIGASFPSEPGVGYSIKRDVTDGPLTFRGSLITDDVICAVQKTGCGYNLISNPFTSNISSKQLLQQNSSNLMMQAVWLWNQEEDNYEVYVAADDFIIAPTQGFLVKAKNNADITISKDIRCTDCSGTFQKTAKSEIHLKMTDGNKNRIAKIYYNQEATIGFDNGLDGRTYHGNANPLDIYTHLLENSSIGGLSTDAMKFQVQSLPNSEYEEMVIPIGITAGTGKQISINAEINNLPTNIRVYLEDRENNTFTDLGLESFNTTISNALNGFGRFYLHTTTESALSTDDIIVVNPENINIYTTPDNILTITGLNENAAIKLYSIQGKQVLNTNIESTGYSTVVLPKLSKGIYIVSLDNKTKHISKKVIIN